MIRFKYRKSNIEGRLASSNKQLLTLLNVLCPNRESLLVSSCSEKKMNVTVYDRVGTCGYQ